MTGQINSFFDGGSPMDGHVVFTHRSMAVSCTATLLRVSSKGVGDERTEKIDV